MNNPELTALLPLEPPPAPPPGPGTATAALLFTALLLAALLFWWQRPAQRRNRQLRALQRRLAQPHCDTRAAATELDRLLRAALLRPRLEQQTPPASLPCADWQALLDALERARFDREPPPVSSLTALLPAARRLLRTRHGAA